MHARRQTCTRDAKSLLIVAARDPGEARSAAPERSAIMQSRYAIVAARIVAGFSWRVQNAPGRPSDIGVARRGNGTHLLHIVARAVYHDEGRDLFTHR